MSPDTKQSPADCFVPDESEPHAGGEVGRSSLQLNFLDWNTPWVFLTANVS